MENNLKITPQDVQVACTAALSVLTDAELKVALKNVQGVQVAIQLLGMVSRGEAIIANVPPEEKTSKEPEFEEVQEQAS